MDKLIYVKSFLGEYCFDIHYRNQGNFYFYGTNYKVFRYYKNNKEDGEKLIYEDGK